MAMLLLALTTESPDRVRDLQCRTLEIQNVIIVYNIIIVLICPNSNKQQQCPLPETVRA